MSWSDYELGLRVLGAVKGSNPEAIIAGGFARDHILGLPIKDVDIWGKFDERQVFKSLKDAGFEWRLKGFGASSIDTPEVVDLFRVEVWHQEDPFHTIDVDFISIQEQFIGRVGKIFDFGICRAYVDCNTDGEAIVWAEPEFDKDVNNKTITFYAESRSEENLQRVKKDRVPRMREKFPEYTIVGIEV